MTNALDQQRAVHRVSRRSFPAWTAIPDDKFLIVAVQELFLKIEAARLEEVLITPEGNTFIENLTGSVLKYLGEHSMEKQAALAHGEGLLDSYGAYTELDDKKYMSIYPEGGFQAWSVVFGSWCGLLASIGITNIMGSFQAYISEHQLKDYDESTIGWIFSLYAFLAFFCGVYVGPIFDKYGPRWPVLAGSTCVVMDMMLLGLCTRFWHFILVFSVLGGLGTALMFTPCIAVIGHYFKAGRGSATGIAVSSGAFGGIVLPLMLEQLLPNIGFAWTTRIIGCIYFILCGVANILIRSRLPPIMGASAKPDFRIFRDKSFALTVAGVFLLEWALFVPLTYICSYATAQGFSIAISYDTLIFLNVGSFVGRLLPGYIADRMGYYNTNIIVILLAITCVFGIWLPASSTTGGLIVFALLFGFASGSNISLAPVCLGELCRTEEYGRYYATCFTVVSFGCLTGVPIAGRMLNIANGSYWGLIVFTGSCYTASLMAFTIARVRATGWTLKFKY